MAQKSSDLEVVREAILKAIRLGADTYQPLNADFERARTSWRQDRSQFWTRTSVRCLFAVVEAILFQFRKMAEHVSQVTGVTFEPEEVAILTEQRINAQGQIVPKFLRFPDAVKESFRLFGKAAQKPVNVDYGAKGFQDLCTAYEVRSRLAHPKGPFDVQIADTDIRTADSGISWFNQAHRQVLIQCGASISDFPSR
jgi:aldehyde:ferredoxin oxidoreductase